MMGFILALPELKVRFIWGYPMMLSAYQHSKNQKGGDVHHFRL